MKVKRIVATLSTSAPKKAKSFYEDILGLDVLMDMEWIITSTTSKQHSPA